VNLFKVIIRPVVTEKGVKDNSLGKHTFYVHKDSTKIDVKKAIELLYEETVEDVNILRAPKKVRMIGRDRHITKRKAYKKAVVTLKNKKKVFDPLKVKSEK